MKRWLRLIGLRLGVVPGSRTCRYSGFVELNLERMVLVGTGPGKAVKGENVKGIRVRNAFCDLARQIVPRWENPAPTLMRQDLQCQVSIFGLSCRFHSFLELHVFHSSVLA